MASSPEKPHHHLPPLFATAAPPPTPSSHPNLTPQPTTPDFLSHLLHRLPPSLSPTLPTRRSQLSSSTSTTTTTTAPIIPLFAPTPSLHSSSLLSASTELGFFHLTHHRIPAHLPLSAESAALSLFSLPLHRKQLLFPSNWPLGHDVDDDDDGATESFCLDSSISTESTDELGFDALREFSREMEKLGMNILEELCSAVGFHCPAPNNLCPLMWVSDGKSKPGRVYPYAMALHYQIRSEKQSLFSDSGWVSVMGQADSVFVTLGDIAQVWSNGKLKKVRGRPFPSSSDDIINPHSITMSLLITLPVESTIYPLLPDLIDNEENEDAVDSTNSSIRDKRMFDSFSFEDYAWRVYNERLLPKDPLVRYRVR
ncbi:hypothetical protein ACS0TY_000978 [Phlomoides rotata]